MKSFWAWRTNIHQSKEGIPGEPLTSQARGFPWATTLLAAGTAHLELRIDNSQAWEPKQGSKWFYCCFLNLWWWTSLVAQWLRIRLPMQGTRVRALVREDSTYCRATKPVHHNYWACALEPASHNYWAHVPQLLKPVHLEPVLHNKRSHCNEKPVCCNEE